MKYDKFKLLTIIKNKVITNNEIIDNLEEIRLLNQLKWNQKKYILTVMGFKVETKPKRDSITIIKDSISVLSFKDHSIHRMLRVLELEGLI